MSIPQRLGYSSHPRNKTLDKNAAAIYAAKKHHPTCLRFISLCNWSILWQQFEVNALTVPQSCGLARLPCAAVSIPDLFLISS